MRYPIAFALLLAAAGLARAQEPPRPSVDALVEQVTGIRAKRADLDKQEATALAALKAELKRQSDLIDKLGGVGPAPKPPDPKPPEPADPLRAKLKAAFDADPAPLDARREQAKDLAALYRQAAMLAADPEVTTSGDLLRRVRDAAGTLVGVDALKDVRRAAGQELGGVLPTDATLTREQRTAVAALFAKLAATLEEVAK